MLQKDVSAFSHKQTKRSRPEARFMVNTTGYWEPFHCFADDCFTVQSQISYVDTTTTTLKLCRISSGYTQEDKNKCYLKKITKLAKWENIFLFLFRVLHAVLGGLLLKHSPTDY